MWPIDPLLNKFPKTIDFSWKQSRKCNLEINDYDHNIALGDEEDEKECNH